MNHSIIAIIQARAGSSRFPGKVMYPLSGKPALGQTIASVLQALDRKRIYVATSLNPESAPVAAIAAENGVNFFQGDERNVASRFKSILESAPCEWFVRLSGDSPLIDYRIILSAAELLEDGLDIVTTASPRNYPSGMNVEIVRKSTYLSAYPSFTAPGHFEHVTTYFYEHPERFVIRGMSAIVSHPERYKFSFDTEQDRLRIERIFDALTRPHYCYTLEEKCRFYRDLCGGASC
jgi:spore coat polysaccharide biosynthesis protein SpsF